MDFWMIGNGHEGPGSGVRSWKSLRKRVVVGSGNSSGKMTLDMNCIPLRIVPASDGVKDYLFGPRPVRLENTDCRCVMRIDLEDRGILFLGLTSCFGFITDHLDELLFSDEENVIVEMLPRETTYDDDLQFHPLVGLARLPEKLCDFESDGHRLGGDSYWLMENPNPNLRFIAQLAFPDHRDLLMSLNWPTGEYTIELFYHVLRDAYAVVWRMHC